MVIARSVAAKYEALIAAAAEMINFTGWTLASI
jgi:hypothetical protein